MHGVSGQSSVQIVSGRACTSRSCYWTTLASCVQDKDGHTEKGVSGTRRPYRLCD